MYFIPLPGGSMAELITELDAEQSTQVDVQPATTEYGSRILYLQGEWQQGDRQLFRFRGTLLVDRNGSLDGTIFWHGLKAWGRAVDFFGDEIVSGAMQAQNVEIAGMEKNHEWLALDEYKIVLSGDDACGTFAGTSRTHGNWDGVMQGAYSFVNRGRSTN
jgi:hypothetical protein